MLRKPMVLDIVTLNMRMYGCQYDLLYFLVKIHV